MLKATIEGVDVTISGLEQFSPAVREGAMHGVIQGLKIAQEASKTMISADDHTLAELAKMGHPYGYTHPQQIHTPDEVVHTQSGEYLDALKTVPPIGQAEAIVEGKVIDEDPKDRWIQEGTTMMRARPWMEEVVHQFGEDIAEAITASITAAMDEQGAR